MKISLLHRRCMPLVALLALPAFAQQADTVTDPVRRDVMPRSSARATQVEGGRSLSDAVRRVQRRTGGQILGAERIPFDGRSINRVKYMDDHGRVRYMDDPAPTRDAPRAEPAAMSPPPRGDNP